MPGVRGGLLASSQWLARRWKRLLVLLFGLPLLTWLLSWAVLASPFGRAWMAGMVEERTGFSCKIDGFGYIPGGQVWLNDIELEPVGRIEKVRVDPAWLLAVRGRLQIEEVWVESPHLDLSPEDLRALVKSLPKAQQQAETPSPGDAGAAAPATGSEAKPSRPSADAAPPQGSGKSEPSDPSEGQPRKARKAQAAAPASRWVHISGGEILLRGERNGDAVFSLGDIVARLPLDGEGSEGFLRLGQPRLAGEQVGAATELPVNFRGGLWTCAVSLEDSALGKHQIFAQLGARRQMPFAVNVISAIRQVSLGANELEGTIAAQSSLAGLIFQPGSWRGFLRVGGRQLVARREGREVAEFETVEGQFSCRAGRLALTNLALIGDQGALLGLGGGSFGHGYLRLRTVVAPNYRAPADKVLARLERGWRFRPLITPDRYFADIDLNWRGDTVELSCLGFDGALPLPRAYAGLFGPAREPLTNELNLSGPEGQSEMPQR